MIELMKRIQGMNLPSVTESVDAMEIEMLKEEQAPCPVYHHFSPGIYVREVNLPAGIVAIGHRQKTEHLNVFLKGRVSILNDDGTVSELSAPMMFTGKPGRKCGYIHEDVVWLNIYPTEETDIETLESMFLDKSDNWKNAQIEPVARVADREDYLNLLNEYGITEELVREQTENESDQIPFPNGGYPVGVFDSAIQGKGLFATADIKKGMPIAPARIGNMRTPAGRYANHSIKPNAVMYEVGDDVQLFASEDITGCRGGQLGEEITVNYRDVLSLHHREETCQA